MKLLNSIFGRERRRIEEAERLEIERKYREFRQMYEEECGEYKKEASRIAGTLAKIDMDAKMKELSNIVNSTGIFPFSYLCHRGYLPLTDFWTQDMRVYDRTRETDNTFGEPMFSVSTRHKVVRFHGDYAHDISSDPKFDPLIDYFQENGYQLMDKDQFLLPFGRGDTPE